MRHSFPFLFLSLLLFAIACNKTQPLTIPGEKPDQETEQAILSSIIRYHGEMPEKANHQTKFDTVFDDHYNRQLKAHRIDRMVQKENTDEYFLLVSRIAPSLAVKRVSTGIHLKMDQEEVTFYNEVFRTWRLPEDVIFPRADSLFALMVQGADLTPYYTAQKGDQYIEFPDQHTWYDTLARHWVSDLEDPIRELKEEFSKEWEEKQK